MNRTGSSVVFSLAALGVVSGVLIWGFDLVGFRQLRGFYAPFFDSEGTRIYYVERRVAGLYYGLGWRDITPPGNIIVFSDEVTLRRIRFDGRGDKVLQTWPLSPMAGEILSAWRGELFGTFDALLDVRNAATIRYWAQIRPPDGGTPYQVAGIWTPETAGRLPDWAALEAGVLASPAAPVADGWEAVMIPGPESFSEAIVLYHREDQKTRILRATKDFRQKYSDGVPVKLAARHARRDIRKN